MSILLLLIPFSFDSSGENIRRSEALADPLSLTVLVFCEKGVLPSCTIKVGNEDKTLTAKACDSSHAKYGVGSDHVYFEYYADVNVNYALEICDAPTGYIWERCSNSNGSYLWAECNDMIFKWKYGGDEKVILRLAEKGYTITCSDTGDGGTTSKEVSEGSSVTINAGIKTGYDFLNWTDSSGTIKSTSSSYTINYSDLSGDITLTANWTPQKYSITYNYTGDLNNTDKLDADWGGRTAPTTHTYDTATTLVLPSRNNYTFAGWYKSSDCSGTALTSLSGTGYTTNIVLYGKWTRGSSLLTITPQINGAGNYSVVLYLLKDGKVQSQIVATNGKTIKLWQRIGGSYSILIGKPYMWSLSVSGDCTQDTTNLNKIDYTVTVDDKTITLTISGGASSSVVVI